MIIYTVKFGIDKMYKSSEDLQLLVNVDPWVGFIG